MKQVKHEKAQKELRKCNKSNSGIERLAQALEEEFAIVFNRLQATPRIQIYDGTKLQSKSHSLLSPSLPKALQK
jgi:hypothetical protein